eukprot:scaffold15285_cov102-Isochrysis_galbana.AAC.1
MSRIALGTLCAGCTLIGLHACLLSRRLAALEKQLLLLSQKSRSRQDAEAVRPQTFMRPPARDVSVTASSLLLRPSVSPATIPPPPLPGTNRRDGVGGASFPDEGYGPAAGKRRRACEEQPGMPSL